ncbi:MAG: hypothetical protein JWN48_3309 [Myxococcaceae bacterium]|nr:hypothetical protein [Myxococcaceae bacterium]
MRLALSSCLALSALSLAAGALVSCSDDGPGDGSFKSPFGDPGGSVRCEAPAYLLGTRCVSPSMAGIDGGAATPRDAAADGATRSDGGVITPRSFDASSLFGGGS